MSVAEWTAGVTRQPKKVSLRGNQPTQVFSLANPNTSSASAAATSPMVQKAAAPVAKPITSFAPKPVSAAPTPAATPAGPEPPTGAIHVHKF